MSGQVFGDRLFCPACLAVQDSVASVDAISKCKCGFAIGGLLDLLPSELRTWLRVGDRTVSGDRLAIEPIDPPDAVHLGPSFKSGSRGATGDVATVGRNNKRDFYLNDESVAPEHAVLVRLPAESGKGKDTWIVAGPESTGLWVDGKPVVATRLQPYDRIQLGRVSLYLEKRRRGFELSSPRPLEGGRIESSRSLTIEHGEYTFTQGQDLCFHERQLVAVIGESGCGKSTFLKALAGVIVSKGIRITRADGGPADIGYVPQNMPQATTLQMHDTLSPRQTLKFAARLRCPDLAREDVADRVDDAIAEMGLGEQADRPVRDLSGGQVTRVSAAMELVAEPNVLFLDEPTTGLDPGWDDDMMRRFRLLSRRGPCVVLTTHNLSGLDRVDQLIILGKRTTATGIVADVIFSGTPQKARQVFGDDLQGVFDGQESAANRAQQTNGTALASPNGQRVGTREPTRVRQRPWVLTKRELVRLLGSRSELVISLVLPVLIGLLFRLSLGTGVTSTSLGFLAVVAMIWLGMNAASHAIAGERAILRRELRVFLRPWSFVLAKFAAAWFVVLIQAGLLGLMIRVPGILPHERSQLPWLFLILVVSGSSGVAVSLLISALAPGRQSASLAVVLVVLLNIVPSVEVAGNGRGVADPNDAYGDFSLSTLKKRGSKIHPTRSAIWLSYATISRPTDEAMRAAVLHEPQSLGIMAGQLSLVCLVTIVSGVVAIGWLRLGDGQDLTAAVP